MVNRLKILVRSYYQERHAARELSYYKKRFVDAGLSMPNKDNLAEAIKTRLRQRKIYPRAKKQGDLNIFITCSMNNWEVVLPKALSLFGNVNVFSWQSTEFFKCRQHWAKWQNDLNEQ